MTNDWILVGVDGGEGGEAAVRYAAAEAVRDGSGLKLVHVAPQLAYAVAIDPDRVPSTHDRRERALLDAAAIAQQVIGGASPAPRIVTEVEFGPRVERLVAASAGCRLVVLGDQHRPLLDRIVTGSVVAGVASHAHVPVVRVPAGQALAPEHDEVVVAVKRTEDWDALLEVAFGIAAARHARLVMLHAWQAPILYEDLTSWPEYDHEWEQRARQELRTMTERESAAHPEVPVDLRVIHGQPAKVVADASRRADLVLLARRSRTLLPGHLGGTARAVLRESACPVEVLPPDARTAVQDLLVEADGRLQPHVAVPMD